MGEWEVEGDGEREAGNERRLFLGGESVDYVSLFSPKTFQGLKRKSASLWFPRCPYFLQAEAAST